MEELNNTKINPWLSMWTKPRETVQYIIDNNPDKFMVAKNGEAYLTNLTEKTQIIISWLENKCELNLVINLKNRDEETLGPYKCLLK